MLGLAPFTHGRSSKRVATTVLLALVLVRGASPAVDEGWRGAYAAGVAAYRGFEYTQASTSLGDALARAQAAGVNDRSMQELLVALADLRLVLGEDRDAEALYGRVLKAAGTHRDLETQNHARWALFALFTAHGSSREAQVVLRGLEPESPVPATSMAVLADAHEIGYSTVLSGFPIKYSEMLARRALLMHERVFGPDSVATPLTRLAEVMKALGRTEEADHLLNRARGLGAR